MDVREGLKTAKRVVVKVGTSTITRPAGGSNLVRMEEIAREIAEQFPILLAVEPTLDVALAEENPNVSYRLYGTAEGTWLLVVNKTTQEQTAVFSVPEGAKIVETRPGEPAVQNGARVSVVLQSLEPKLIRVK